MKIVFVGCVTFSRHALQALLDKNAQIVAIFTIDEAHQNGISDFAVFDDLLSRANIPIFKINDINSEEVIELLGQLQPDLIYVVGWSWLIKQKVLDIPTKGVLGLHPTLLPEGRGRAPIPWTILKGLKKSGVSLFYCVAAADAGDIVKQISYDIDENETATTLYKKVCDATYRLIASTYPAIYAGREERMKQDALWATHWKKRRPEEGLIHWHQNADIVYSLIRAVTHPYPGAFTYHNGKKLFIWKARLGSPKTEGVPGVVIRVLAEEGVLVQTKEGTILLETIQYEGGKQHPAAFFLQEGDRFYGNK